MVQKHQIEILSGYRISHVVWPLMPLFDHFYAGTLLPFPLDSGCGEGGQYKDNVDHDLMQSTLLFSHVR